ncbi:MAG TPA: DUF2231 domain-containing protein [Gammaproteobacteria bacterium]|nr:DUF2231 domain-containing protein [Gammaproteobacteria bacterium]
MKRLPWHPAIVHFPLACWVLATLLDLAHLFALDARIGQLDASAAAALLLWFGLAAALAAVAAGLADYLAQPRAVQDAPELTWHITWMSIALLLFFGAALWRLRLPVFAAPLAWYVTGLEICGSLCLVIGGHYAAIVVYRRMASPPSCER